MKKLAIIGAGTLGRQLCHMAVMDNQYDVTGFYDDVEPIGENINGYKVLGNLKYVLEDYSKKQFDYLILGIGYKNIESRADKFEFFKQHIPFGRIIHSSSFIDRSAKIGDGTVIFPGCIIDQNVMIESNVLLHIGCKISHDTIIKSHTYISPSVSVAGFVQIGEKCNLGINTVIIDSIHLQDGIQTGGGTVVIENLEKPGLYVGNPSRFIR